MTTRYSEHQQSAIRVQRWLLLFYLVFVVYGSLVPLDFVAHPWDASVQTLLGLRDLPLDFSSRSDWATNLVLFIPLTFLAGQSFGSATRGITRVLIGVLIAAAASALAVGIEFTQMFFPPRTPSQNDIVALSISGAIGVCVQWAVGHTVSQWVAGYWQVQMQGEKVSRLLKGYLFVLLAFNVMPLDLTISPVEIFHKWSEGRFILVPFAGLHGSGLEMLYQVLTDVLIWVPAGALWALQPGRGLWPVVRKGLLAAAVIEGLQLFVLSRTTDITSVGLAGVGSALGALAVLRLGNRGLARIPASTWTLWFMVWLVAVVNVFWLPFDFDLYRMTGSAFTEAFTRAPLNNYYFESEFIALNEVLRKTAFFVPGGLLLGLTGLARNPRGSKPSKGALLLLVLLAFVIETGQLMLPERICDLTDFLLESLGGILGYAMARWIGSPAAVPARRTAPLVSPAPVSAPAPAEAAPRDAAVTTTTSATTAPASPRTASARPPALRPLPGSWRLGYILLAMAATAYSGYLCAEANITTGSSILILGALFAMLAVPRFPWLGPAAYVVAAYGLARYSDDYEALLRTGILHWALALAVVGWAVSVRSGRSRPRLEGWLMWNTVLLAVWACLCVLAAWARSTDFQYASMLHPTQFVHGWILMLLAAQVMGQRQASWGFGFVLCAAVVLRALVQGTAQIFLEGDIAALCVMALPIALFGAFAAPALWLRYAFGGLGVALLTTFAMAQNRGAAVGLALALLCIWWNTRKRWLWALSAIPLLALAMFLVPGGYIDRFRVVIDPAAVTPTAGLDRSTVDERKELWTAAGTIFVDHPLMGVGPGNSIAALKLYRPGYSRIRIHNTFIDAAIETGAVGFVLFTVLIAGALFLLQRRMQRAEHADARPCLRAVQAALAAYVGICLFISRYDMQLAYLLVGWAAALVASPPALFAHSNAPRRHRKSRSKEQSAPDPTAQAAL